MNKTFFRKKVEILKIEIINNTEDDTNGSAWADFNNDGFFEIIDYFYDPGLQIEVCDLKTKKCLAILFIRNK